MGTRRKSRPGVARAALERLSAQDRLLFLLKTRTGCTAGELARALHITGEGVRQQLVRLQAEGLVEATTEVHGVGRPFQRWSLTRAANKRFPDGHAGLAVELIETVRKTLGEEALNRVIAARGEQLKNTYAARLSKTRELTERLEQLVSLRNQEGYMAEWRREPDGFLVIEHHCPLCAAAGSCISLCRSELELFGNVLGPGVKVEREEHQLAGSRRCVFRIRRDAKNLWKTKNNPKRTNSPQPRS